MPPKRGGFPNANQNPNAKNASFLRFHCIPFHRVSFHRVPFHRVPFHSVPLYCTCGMVTRARRTFAETTAQEGEGLSHFMRAESVSNPRPIPRWLGRSGQAPPVFVAVAIECKKTPRCCTRGPTNAEKQAQKQCNNGLRRTLETNGDTALGSAGDASLHNA